MSDVPQQQTSARPLWVPPVASVATLFVLFLVAMFARRSSFADAARPVTTTVSTVAAVAIGLYGLKMVVDARVRGIASALIGAVMIIMGVYTTLHVLR